MAMKKDADKTTSKKVEKISKKLKVFKSPSAFSVLFIIIAIMAGLTWLIPVSYTHLTLPTKLEV